MSKPVRGFKFILFIFVVAFNVATADVLAWYNERVFIINRHSYILHKTTATWAEAKESCSAAGALLLGPDDEAEAIALRGEINKDADRWGVWTGINDLDKVGDYRTADGRPLSAYNHSGGVKWDQGKPDSNGGTSRCVVLQKDSSLWVMPCVKRALYVCKYPSVDDCIAPASPTAPPDDLPHSNHAFEKTFKIFTIKSNSTTPVLYVYHSDLVTWSAAKERCAGASARLLVPADQAEARSVMREVGRVDSRWGIWTGIYDDNRGDYQTLDGWLFNATDLKWAAGEPDSNGGRDGCVMLWPDALLDVYHCGWINPYVCKFRISATAP